MKKVILPLVLASIVAAPAAFSQGSSVDSRTQKSYNLLVSQYSTASLGYFIEQRCRQLDENAFKAFSEDQFLLNKFMLVMMGQDVNTKVLDSIKKTALDEDLNPCNGDTFRFAVTTMQVASQLATRVKLLSDEELDRLRSALTKPVEVNEAQPNQTQTPPQQQQAVVTTTPEPEPQVQPEPVQQQSEPVQQQSEPVDTIEFVPTTSIDRQPESKPRRAQQAESQVQEATPTPTPTPSGPTQTASVAGITLANYVNPFPYTAPPPPPGETEKDMKRRHRQEIIDLRRNHRAELDAFDDYEDRYADPDAVKDYIKDRQDDEFDAMRNRHLQELDRF